MNLHPSISGLLAVAALASITLFTAPAQAHDVWLEDTPQQQLVIHFGEFGDELETSPGYLDSLTQPQTWTLTNSSPSAFAIQKQTNSFLLVNASPTNMAAAETDFEVLSETNKPARLPIFYARWQPIGAGPGKPTLTLDLVPLEIPGYIRVYFRGRPVTNETVTAYGPNDYSGELKTDANGYVHFKLKNPGFYLFTCNHYREDRFGYAGGRPYDLVSHNASLTLRLP